MNENTQVKNEVKEIKEVTAKQHEADKAVTSSLANGQTVPGFSNLQSFELAGRISKALAASTLVPKEYQGNIANCLVVVNMASRMNADPLMIMQNMYMIDGRPGWSSQFLISMFNASGRFTPLRYDWVGDEGTDDWGCIAWSVDVQTGERLEGSPITIGISKKEGWFNKKGSMWQSLPKQMLMYRAAAFLIRAYAPEIAMGIHTAEEVFDIQKEEHSQPFNGKSAVLSNIQNNEKEPQSKVQQELEKLRRLQAVQGTQAKKEPEVSIKNGQAKQDMQSKGEAVQQSGIADGPGF